MKALSFKKYIILQKNIASSAKIHRNHLSIKQNKSGVHLIE